MRGPRRCGRKEVRPLLAFTIQLSHSFSLPGLLNLRRYFELIVFQAYLQSTEPDTMRTVGSFESFVKSLPVLKTFEKELVAEGLAALKPLLRVDVADGVALPDEVTSVVTNRSGSILSASTILKSDFFSNLQKMTLPEYAPPYFSPTINI